MRSSPVCLAMGLRDQLLVAAQRLTAVADRPRFEAELIWAHVLGLSRASLLAADDVPPSEAQLATADALIERRLHGEPMAYLLGRRGFWMLDLRVSPDTLIPRPETELLVDWVLAELPDNCDCRIADLGTGSGAIALAIASERPRAAVVAIDASAAALDVAQDNARQIGLLAVEFHCGSWCEPLKGLPPFDVIVSNPPYVAAGDPHLADLRFEPLSALVSGTDGLDAIRAIVEQARAHLRSGGALRIEHGALQGAAVRELLSTAGYVGVETRCDLEGRERATGGRRP